MIATTDPIADADRWLAAIPIETSSVICVIGLGQGYLLDALERRGWRGRVIALEPDASHATECLDRRVVQAWRDDGRLTIVTGPGYNGLDRSLMSAAPTAEQPAMVVNPAVALANREQAVQAARLIGRAWFGARANQQAKRDNGTRYLLNTLRNARTIVAEGDAAALAGIASQVPAIVVGAGPSLDRNLPDLAACHDRALIIAADTSLRPLLAAGVHPDVVVALDPTETNARHLSDLPPCPGTYLVAEGSLDPEALSHFAGRTFFFNVADHHPWPWLRSLGISRGRLRAWGSVLTTAFDLALTMDCDPIVFAGADLAFTDGRPYARGTTFEEVWYRAQAWGQPLEECWSAALAAWPEIFEADVHGAAVRTAPHLRAFRDWIAKAAETAADRTIINGTGGGILVGPAIAQSPLAGTLSARPPIEATARRLIASAWRPEKSAAPKLSAAIDAPTLEAWREFGGASDGDEDIMRALGRAGDSALSVNAVVPDVAPAPQPAVEPVAQPPGVVLVCSAGDHDLAATIEQAWRCRGDVERLTLIDQTGVPGGAAVRRALFCFLERHPEVSARHGRFFDPSCDTSWIDSRPPRELFPGPDLDKFASAHEAVATRLAPLIVAHFKPASVLDIGCGAGYWLRALESHGVAEIYGVEDAALVDAAGIAPAPGSSACDLALFEPPRPFDLCLCLGVVQRTDAATANAVVAACTRASDTVVFSAPAPAIGLPGFVNERPSSVWHERFLRQGFAAHDELRPRVEEAWGRYLTSYDLLTVYRRIADRGDHLPTSARHALLAAACRTDDLALQTHWYAHAASIAPAAARTTVLPQVRSERLTIPASRMESGAEAGVRVFRFRTTAAALAMTADGIDPPSLEEDQRPLRRVASPNQVTSDAGTFAIHEGSITFSAVDGGDPRRNGHRYDVVVPAYVAWLDRLAFATIQEHGL